MKCFYHSDMDGRCAGAVVRMTMENIGVHGQYYQINYNDRFPFEEVVKDELIVIVDFSLQGDGGFERLLTMTSNVVWIDHHKTAIEKNEHLKEMLDGARGDKEAGCVLTWKWFHKDETVVPLAVQMIGSYDIWDFSVFGEDLLRLQAGLRLYDTTPESGFWDEFLYSGLDSLLGRVIESGDIVLRYKRSVDSLYVRSFGFFCTLDKYRVVACNMGMTSSQLFDVVDPSEYDLMCPFVFDGRTYAVSVYSKDADIDCSEIAKRRGGGGHKQAAGFQCTMLPFDLSSAKPVGDRKW